ncbi:Flavoredoxin [Methanoculleus chikugoensis]|uniref:Flavoredoxin n=2 Tax=Methanoculleus chikugoensis TaxID=118126 RepID=A0A1M4MKF9_9EURY|nr:Flavoredoxin [Methanoculleus chikugoensis]
METNHWAMTKRSIGPRTLLYPHPDLIIGTYDASGRPDAMAAAWGGICSSRPPSVAVSVQKTRQTYANLVEQREFTISIPSTDYVREADYFGIVSGRDEEKFAATGLTPVKSDLVNAPYVGEFPVVLECRLLQTVEIGVHTQFIGEILDVKVEESVLGEDGRPDIEKIRPFAYDSMRQEYYGFGKVLAKAFSAGKEFKK